MMVQPSPSAPFVMTQPHFLLELLVIALDPPSEFGPIDQIFEADIGG